jgi:hypothetical protein
MMDKPSANASNTLFIKDGNFILNLLLQVYLSDVGKTITYPTGAEVESEPILILPIVTVGINGAS